MKTIKLADIGKYRGKKAVVIGSSPSLLGQKMGKVVDEYDLVLRVNWFPSQGYSEDIGTKTDFLVVGCDNFYFKSMKYHYNFHCRKHGCKPEMDNIILVQNSNPTNELIDSLLGLYDKQEIITAQNEISAFMKNIDWRSGRSKSGIYAIIIAHLLTGQSVDLLGFGKTSEEKYHWYYHITENSDPYTLIPFPSDPKKHLNIIRNTGIIDSVLDELKEVEND